jgi:hypothetical protein
MTNKIISSHIESRNIEIIERIFKCLPSPIFIGLSLIEKLFVTFPYADLTGNERLLELVALFKIRGNIDFENDSFFFSILFKFFYQIPIHQNNIEVWCALANRFSSPRSTTIHTWLIQPLFDYETLKEIHSLSSVSMEFVVASEFKTFSIAFIDTFVQYLHDTDDNDDTSKVVPPIINQLLEEIDFDLCFFPILLSFWKINDAHTPFVTFNSKIISAIKRFDISLLGKDLKASLETFSNPCKVN